jgi:hypothetical protein
VALAERSSGNARSLAIPVHTSVLDWHLCPPPAEQGHLSEDDLPVWLKDGVRSISTASSDTSTPVVSIFRLHAAFSAGNLAACGRRSGGHYKPPFPPAVQALYREGAIFGLWTDVNPNQINGPLLQIDCSEDQAIFCLDLSASKLIRFC